MKQYTNEQLAEMFDYLHTNHNSVEMKLLTDWERTFIINGRWIQLYCQDKQGYHLITDKQWAVIERIAKKLEWE